MSPAMETPSPTLARLWDWGERELQSAGITDARSDARVLLCEAARITRERLITHRDEPCPEDGAEKYVNWVRQRAKRVPLPYIIGVTEFYGLRFHIGPGVLIPRPETETLVERALAIMQDIPAPRVLDVGCGCGIIGLSIASEHPACKVVLADAYPVPVRAALTNARLVLGGDRATRQVRTIQTYLADGLQLASFDIVCANLPYVPSQDCQALQPEIADYEPRAAVDGGEDGLRLIDSLVLDVHRRATTGTWLLLEIGYGQAGPATQIFQARGFSNIVCREDLAGVPRVVEGQVG